MHRFNDDWMVEPELRDWLVKVSNDDTRAYCRYCAIVLRAHKSDLICHGATGKHGANAAKALENGISTAPISVQIVCNDEEPAEDEGLEQDEETKPEIANTTDLGPRPKKSRPSACKYLKKYRPEWEQDPDLKDWLTAHPTNISKAMCKFCEVHLRAHKHDLCLHGRSNKHKKVVASSERTFDVPLDILPSSSNSALKLDFLAISEGITSQVIEIVDDPKTDRLSSGSGNTSNSRHNRDKPKQGFSSYKRKYRLNAADVVEAIENNEFTGYELLQIVKRAVPKL